MDKTQAFDLTDDHLKLLRELVIVWIEAEAGAPAVYSFALPTFLRHGQIEPGHYQREKPYGPWILVNS